MQNPGEQLETIHNPWTGTGEESSGIDDINAIFARCRKRIEFRKASKHIQIFPCSRHIIATQREDNNFRRRIKH